MIAIKLVLNIIVLIVLMNFKTFHKVVYYILMILNILLMSMYLHSFWYTLNVNYIALIVVKLFIINELLRINKNINFSNK